MKILHDNVAISLFDFLFHFLPQCGGGGKRPDHETGQRQRAENRERRSERRRPGYGGIGGGGGGGKRPDHETGQRQRAENRERRSERRRPGYGGIGGGDAEDEDRNRQRQH